MAEEEIDNVTIEQYLTLSRRNQTSGVVKPKIRGNANVEIKSQFMRELRDDAFSENKNDDAHEHVERVLDIASLFSIPGVTYDAVMLRTAKQLEEIRNFKQKAMKHCTRLEKDSQGPILGMTPAQALTAIQTMVDHSQKWHDGSSSRNVDSNNNSKGIDAIIIKSMEDVKYGEYGRPFPNNNRNVGRFNRGVARYNSHDQPSSGKRKPSISEIINKYMEEAAKKHAKQDEWLRKFYQITKTNRENHDKIIQSLETKVKTLTNKVEGHTNGGKFEECKAIFSEDRSPLYIPFYYSPEEIQYFSAISGFSDKEKQETNNNLDYNERCATINITPNIKQAPQEKKQDVRYYVEPYKPSIPFPKRLEHHAEEALVHETMESLKKIRINRPLLKEIRQTKNYAKHIKDLVLPPKEQDPGSFILPCSIGRLDSNHALVDLGASISVMPLSMYKRLGMGKLAPINIDMIEDFKMPIILGRSLLATAYAKVNIFRKSILLEVGNERVMFKTRHSFANTPVKSVPIDPDIFPYDIDVQVSYEEVVYRMTEQEDPWKIKEMDEANMERHQDFTTMEKPKVH
ncbi:hypothetical protein Tco_1213064 [Tanacetum coccineum]